MFTTQTPIQKIETAFVKHNGFSLHMKRDDKIHPFVSGNKWYKLKYNFEAFHRTNATTIITFGGAYSNHLIATAVGCAHYRIPCIGIVRGDELKENSNYVLRMCAEFGMKLEFVTRKTYRSPSKYLDKFDRRDVFIIPEGGDNANGVKGCEEIVSEYDSFDHIVVPVGTGTTFLGVIQGSKGKSHIHGVCAAGKGGSMLPRFQEQAKTNNWTLHTHYHFGGFGKFDAEQAAFNKVFASESGILLDPIYTGKMMRGVYDLFSKNKFKQHERVLCIHTGGLTGLLSDNWLAS